MTTRISAARYTLSAWRRCHPGATDDDWDRDQSPMDIFTCMEKEVGKAAPNLDLSPDTIDVRFVMIDEEYFEWLKDTGKEDCPHSREDYVRSVSDESAERLFAKHDMNIAASLAALTVACPSRDHEASGRQRLSQKQVEMIRRELLERLDVDGVVVSGILTDPKNICKDEYEIKQRMLRGDSLSIWETDDIFLDNMCGLSLLAMPVLLFKRFDDPTFSLYNDENLRDFYFAENLNLNPGGGYEDPFTLLMDVNGEAVQFHVSPVLRDLSDTNEALEGVCEERAEFLDRVSDVFRVDLIRAEDDGIAVMSRIAVSMENERDEEE